MYKIITLTFLLFVHVIITKHANARILITAPLTPLWDNNNHQMIDYRNTTEDEYCPSFVIWPALKPKALIYRILSLDKVIIHHTLGVRCWNHEICSTIVKNIQNYSMGKGNCLDIKYNFLIGEDGNIYKGSDWFRTGCHTKGSNDRSVGIAFIGDFSDSLPNSQALENVKKLINCGLKKKFLNENYKLYGGKQLDLSTKSPGIKLFNEIKKWQHWSQ